VNDSSARIRELLALYRRTHYDLVIAPGSKETLRIGALPPPSIAEWIGAAGPAIYLSACNPRSTPLSDAENRARMDALREGLRDAGARWLEGEAGIPGKAWSEASLLVAGLGMAGADRLARRFEQDAALVVAGNRRVVLRLYRDEWRPLAGDGDDVEWAEPA